MEDVPQEYEQEHTGLVESSEESAITSNRRKRQLIKHQDRN